MIGHGRPAREEFPPEMPPVRRYTLVGDETFEQQVKQDLSRLAADAELSLSGEGRALLLVGRFARGEGSVISKAGEAHAYPGYHCLALMERESGRGRRLVSELQYTWTRHLRTRVEIDSCLADTLPTKPRSLWWLDLARGNVEVLSGDPDVLRALPRMDASDLHPDEAGWLLVEQATLLALAQRDRETGTSGGVPQIVYRIHNMALACGDAEQLLKGHFAGGLRTRLAQLRALGAPSEHWELYADAIRFLTRPDLWKPPGDLNAWQRATLGVLERWHLALEHLRAHAPTSLRRYARHRGRLFERRRPRGWRNLQLCQRPKRPLFFPYVGDPREKLARAAVALAYGHDHAASNLMAERLLGHPGLDRSMEASSLLTPLRQLYQDVRMHDRDDPVDGSFYT